MFPDSDPTQVPESAPPSPSLPKWPFVLGDIILLAAGLALWATQAPLTPLQTLIALGALGLGALLFVLPFVMEYMTSAQLRGLELEQVRAEDYQRLAALDAETRKQARTAIESQEHAARATAALENLARKLDARLTPLEATQKGFEAALAELKEATAQLAAQKEYDAERRQAHADKLAASVTALTAAIRRVDALADQPPAGPDPGTVATLETIHERLEIMAHLLAQFRLPEPDLNLPKTPPATKDKDPGEGGSMLAKALSSTQPVDESSAVSRIIESRPRKPRKPKTAPAPETAPESPPPPAADSSSDDPVESSATSDSSTDDLAESAVADPDELPDPETLFETPGESIEPIDEPLDDGPEAAAAPDPEAAAPEPETPPVVAEQPVLLDTGAETTRKRRSKSAAPTATLVARVLIGIGNKPYVRGEGPGLSAEKGVPMEFVEIGQWRWVAPANATDTIRVRIYKNDEVPAEGGPIVLEPGQTLEVNPEFAS